MEEKWVPGRSMPMRNPASCADRALGTGLEHVGSDSALPLRLAARQLLQLLLVFAARSGPLRLGGGFFTGGAFYRFPLLFVLNLGGIGH